MTKAIQDGARFKFEPPVTVTACPMGSPGRPTTKTFSYAFLMSRPYADHNYRFFGPPDGEIQNHSFTLTLPEGIYTSSR